MNWCALALILLLDTSGSVGLERFELQKMGLVQAFRDPKIEQVILEQPNGMALKIIAWNTEPETVSEWIHVQQIRDLDQVVANMENLKYVANGSTAIGRALDMAIASFDSAPCESNRKIIDISGDGSNNDGPDPSEYRDLAEKQSIIINGLPIVNAIEPDVANYYRAYVVTSTGFVLESQGFDDFARAIRKKLILEIVQTR